MWLNEVGREPGRSADDYPGASEPADDGSDWQRGGLGGLFGAPADEYSGAVQTAQAAPAGPVQAAAGPEHRDEPDYGEPEYDEADDGEPGYGEADYSEADYGEADYGEAGYVPRLLDQAPADQARHDGSQAGPGLAARVRRRSPPEPQRPQLTPGRGTHARAALREPGPDEAAGAAVAAVETADGLAPSLLLPARRRKPSPGWRRTVYRASGGLIRVPTSTSELRRRDMISRARTPVAAGHYRVAVLSLKGGVGKTTTVVGLGSTLASLRGDRVIAIDANPDRGTLSDKLTPQTSATVRDLLDDRGQIHRYADVRGFTSQAPSRLEVLASAQDPNVSEAFSEADYRAACLVLERFYSICLTDCGSGLMHSAMAGVLRLADQIVLVSTASVDGARSASACMDWLTAHGHEDLVRNGVVVLTGVRRRASRTAVDLDVLEGHFAARCRAVTQVPFDPYLAQGADVELDQMRRATASAFLELAALVGDGFSRRRAEPRAIAPASG